MKAEVKAVGINPIPHKLQTDLYAQSTQGYVIDLDGSKNPVESIKVWIGSLQKIQLVSRLANQSVFALTEKNMAMESQHKDIGQMYLADIKAFCQEFLKQLCWQQEAIDSSSKVNTSVCKQLLPWSGLPKRRRRKRFGKYRLMKTRRSFC
eukprot:Gb_40222 [translate_table: standard]